MVENDLNHMISALKVKGAKCRKAVEAEKSRVLIVVNAAIHTSILIDVVPKIENRK